MRLRYVIPAVAIALGTVAACGSGSPTATARTAATATAAAAAGNCYDRTGGVTVATTGATPAQCAALARTLDAAYPAGGSTHFRPVAALDGTPVCSAAGGLVYAASAAWIGPAQTFCNTVSALTGQ